VHQVPNHRFLYRRGSTLYFRRAIPAEARAAFNGKREMIVSLKTGSLSEARPKWAALITEFELTLAKISLPAANLAEPPTPELIDEAVRAWRQEHLYSRAMLDFGRDDPEADGLVKDSERYEGQLLPTMRGGTGRRPPQLQTEWIADHLIAQNNWSVDRSSGLYRHLVSRVARGELDLGRTIRKEMEFEPHAVMDSFFGPAEYQADVERQRRRSTKRKVSILALFDAYAAEAELKPATLKAWRTCLASMIAHLGHDDASRVEPKDIVAWKEALAAAGGDDPTRGARTIRDKYLAAAKAVFRWAAENHKIEANPTQGVGIRVKKRARLREPSLSDDEAAIILSASLAEGDTAARSPQAFARRWVPWLCAYTGARVGEITQLRREDVFEEAGIACIRITPEAGTQKTDRAWKVPLHPHLLEQGFVEALGDRSGPLFYDPSNHRGGSLGNPQSKKVAERLAKWVRSIGVDDPLVQPNHGWRHRFKTQARLVGMDPEARDTIQNHSRGTEGDKYGDKPLPMLFRAIQMLPRYDLMSQRQTVSPSSD
jgi:integrase